MRRSNANSVQRNFCHAVSPCTEKTYVKHFFYLMRGGHMTRQSRSFDALSWEIHMQFMLFWPRHDDSLASVKSVCVVLCLSFVRVCLCVFFLYLNFYTSFTEGPQLAFRCFLHMWNSMHLMVVTFTAAGCRFMYSNKISMNSCKGCCRFKNLLIYKITLRHPRL